MAEQEVEYTIEAGVATVVLNRPKALNSLNMNMVTRMSQLLSEWSQPGSPVSCVLVKGAGGKAYCAGGDVKDAVANSKAGRPDLPNAMFDEEYRLNLQIARLKIPYIALIDGFVMGGGVGVSVHGHFRVATERTVFAMPETGIGLYPDVGACYFLQQLTPPGGLGNYLGLTGARLTGIDVLHAGMATHYIPHSALHEVEEAVRQLGRRGLASDLSEVDALLRGLEAPHKDHWPAGQLPWKLPLIDAHFDIATHEHMADVVATLKRGLQELGGDVRAHGSHGSHGQHHHRHHGGSSVVSSSDRAREFLEETLATLNKVSPLSLCVTFELFKRTRHSKLEECLALDHVMIRHFTGDRGDFFEGVTATLVERNRPPRWKHSSVAEVPGDLVESFFAPLMPTRPSSASSQGGGSGLSGGSSKL